MSTQGKYKLTFKIEGEGVNISNDIDFNLNSLLQETGDMTLSSDDNNQKAMFVMGLYAIAISIKEKLEKTLNVKLKISEFSIYEP